ncbi:hypothetical protein [Actinomadura sp. B10D3]|uniref:hypothetical protein n=1 Tax=Actinomadura sp. B10D3 TaxID=3153557 RepID=UPI00325CAB13
MFGQFVVHRTAQSRDDTNAQEVITGWRATARIKADGTQHEEALRPTSGDFGPVEVTP